VVHCRMRIAPYNSRKHEEISPAAVTQGVRSLHPRSVPTS
jgi:hypothetical protein